MRKGRLPKRRWVFATDDFAGGDEGGGALKLLQRQQAQRIAHQHRDTRHAVESADFTLGAAYRQRVGGQPQISLRLAAASREPEADRHKPDYRDRHCCARYGSDRSSPAN